MSAATQPVMDSAWLAWPSQWPGQGDLLQMCQQIGPGPAALLVGAGVVYLLFGFYLFKVLITLNAALIGGFIGAMIGDRMGNIVAGGFLGAFVAGAVSLPLMKYSVAVMGGLVGALIGAGLWQSLGLEAHFAWSGAMMGLIFFGMLSFILFRGSIMMYTSLQGSIMLIIGLLGLVLKYRSAAQTVVNGMEMRPFIFPMIIFVSSVCGVLYQRYSETAKPAGAAAAKK